MPSALPVSVARAVLQKAALQCALTSGAKESLLWVSNAEKAPVELKLPAATTAGMAPGVSLGAALIVFECGRSSGRGERESEKIKLLLTM